MDNGTSSINLVAAERMYSNHIKNVKAYQKRNPEKMRAKCKKYNEKVKTDSEKYQAMLDTKKQYYYDVRKPKIEALKKARLEADQQKDEQSVL